MVSSVVTEQVKMCIQLGLLCTQGDPQLRPTMGRVVLILSKKPPGNMEEPTRPGVPGSRYRRMPRNNNNNRFPITSSTADDDIDSSTTSHTDSSNYGTVSTSTSGTRSFGAAQRDSRGKRPMLD